MRCAPSGHAGNELDDDDDELLLLEPGGLHGPQIDLGTMTTAFVVPHTWPSSFASIVVSPSGLLDGVADTPRTSMTITPALVSRDISVILTRLTPETVISKSSMRSFGVTVIATRSLMSLTHGLSPPEELLDELPPPEAAGIVNPVLIGDGPNTAEQSLLDDELLEEELLEGVPPEEELAEEELLEGDPPEDELLEEELLEGGPPEDELVDDELLGNSPPENELGISHNS